MKAIFIKGKQNTPLIDFNHETGILIISGKSNMDNPTEFYEETHTWIKEYAKDPQKETNLVIFQEIFSSQSLQQIFEIMISLIKIKKSTLKITWLYEEGDEDAQEEGEGVSAMTGIQHFKIMPIGNSIHNSPIEAIMKILKKNL